MRIDRDVSMVNESICDGIVFVIQIVLVIGGALILFAGYTREKLKYERRQTDKRIAKMKRRMRESA